MKPFRRFPISAALLIAAAALPLCAADLPKAETILDKYVEVTGGKAAYAKVHSDISTGTMAFAAMGLKGKMVAYSANPDKRFMEMTMDGLGKFLEGSNGEVAWSMSAVQGPRLKEGDEKIQALQEAKFNSDSQWRDLYTKAETVAIEDIDGKECYKVVLTPKVGKPVTKWYEKDSGLAVKMSVTSRSPMGEIQADSTMSDYRKEGDLLLPHKIVAKAMAQEIVMTIDSVQQNPEIPKDKFDLPAEIQALVKKPAK